MRKSTIALAGVSFFAMAAPAAGQVRSPDNAGDRSATGAESNPAEDDEEVADGAEGAIMVTAQRRQELVTDVPISITVATQAQLERQQVTSFADLNRIAPSLEVQTGGNTSVGGGGSIRGIGTQSANLGAVGSVGVVVDQVSQGNANIADIFDVGRVEVLKGPQGTLFGLTTSAGVINISTNEPDPTEYSGRVRTELSARGLLGSGYGQQVVQGLVNVPVAAEAAVRVSGQYTRRQGMNFNRSTDEWNDFDRYALRGRFLWRPGDAWTFNLIGDYAKQTLEGSDFFTFVRAQEPTLSLLETCGITVREGNQDYCTTYPIFSRSKTYGGSAQVEYDAGPLVVTYIGALRASKNGPDDGNVFRADPLPTSVVTSHLRRNTDLMTHELRISSATNSAIEYTAGLFYSDQDGEILPQRFRVIANTPAGPRTVVDDPGAFTNISDSSRAVFGQATWHVTDQLNLIAGARYTDVTLSVDRLSLAPPPGAPAQAHFSSNYGNFSYRLGAQYDFTRNTMAYATLVRGFKGGQVFIPTYPLEPYLIEPEIPSSYEVGLKTTLFDNWVMDLNAFYQTIKDFQAQQCTTTGNLFQCVQVNIDGVKSRGAEINFFGRVTEALSLNTGLIYAKATYPENHLGSDGRDIGGTQLAFAPRWKFTASGEYEAPVSASMTGFLALDAVWKSRVRFETKSREVADSTFRPHWMVGGRVGLRGDEGGWSASLFVRNLFDVHEPNVTLSAFAEPLNIAAMYGQQSFRNVGLQLDVRF